MRVAADLGAAEGAGSEASVEGGEGFGGGAVGLEMGAWRGGHCSGAVRLGAATVSSIGGGRMEEMVRFLGGCLGLERFSSLHLA